MTSIRLVGHGWGPGIGMGQWGDFGYAVRYHDGYGAILDHFYGGTVSANVSSLGPIPGANPLLKVLILENLNLKTNVGFDPIVTSASGFSITSTSSSPTTQASTTTSTVASTSTSSSSTTILGASTTTAPGVSSTTTLPGGLTTTSVASGPGTISIPGGTAVDLRLGSDGTWSLYEGQSCTLAGQAAGTTTPVATGLLNPVIAPASTSPTAPSTQLLTLCRHDGVDETLRGAIQAYNRSGYERTLNLVPLESYLNGVVPAEESASWGLFGGTAGSPQGEPWGFQALEAQAVAARSYAVASMQSGGWNGYADICDSDQCQAYVGAAFEYPISNLAVATTAGEVRVPAGAANVVSTRFSASTGGWTSLSSFPSVPDLGDDCVVIGNPLECNPNHTWRVTLPASAVLRHYPSVGGRLLGLYISVRNHRGALGGRALDVVIVGGHSTVTVSGSAFASALALRSDWFAVSKLVRYGASATASSTSTTLSSATTLPSSTTSTAPAGSTTSSSSTTTSSSTVPSSSTSIAPTTSTG